jgi:tetratricopeptide (TPR) repeat protein
MAEERPDVQIEAWTVMALNHRLQGRLKAAQVEAQRAWDHAARPQARPRVQAHVAAELAAIALETKQNTAAQNHARTALALYEQAQVNISPLSATAWLVQARLDLAAGRTQAAHKVLGELLQVWIAVNPNSPWQGQTEYWLAAASEKLGDTQAAHTHRQTAALLLSQAPAPGLRALVRQR